MTVVTDGDSLIGDDYDLATAECPASAPYVLGGSAVSIPPAGALTASEPYDFTAGAAVNGTNPITPNTAFTGTEVSGDRYGWVATIRRDRSRRMPRAAWTCTRYAARDLTP